MRAFVSPLVLVHVALPHPPPPPPIEAHLGPRFEAKVDPRGVLRLCQATPTVAASRPLKAAGRSFIRFVPLNHTSHLSPESDWALGVPATMFLHHHCRRRSTATYRARQRQSRLHLCFTRRDVQEAFLCSLDRPSETARLSFSVCLTASERPHCVPGFSGLACLWPRLGYWRRPSCLATSQSASFLSKHPTTANRNWRREGPAHLFHSTVLSSCVPGLALHAWLHFTHSSSDCSVSALFVSLRFTPRGDPRPARGRGGQSGKYEREEEANRAGRCERSGRSKLSAHRW